MTNGKKFDNYQISCFTDIINKQKETKELTEEEFFSLMLRKFVENCDKNEFYKKTPSVFRGLSVFYTQVSLAFKTVYGTLNSPVFDFCHYLKDKTMLLPEIYETRYTAFDVDASEASRILKSLGYSVI